MADDSKYKAIARSVNVLIILLFFACIFAPLADSLFHVDPTKLEENRNPAPKPRWRWNLGAVERFPKAFESWYNDHFGFRNTLIHSLALVRVFGLNDSAQSDVAVGKDGWLYLTNPSSKLMHDGGTLTHDELEYLRQVFEDRYNYLAGMGIPYILFIAPDKQSIYPEYQPVQRPPAPHGSKLDQFIDYLRATTQVPVVDARDVLLQHKNIDYGVPLYYKTDTHWNELGAFLATSQLIDTVRTFLPDVPPAPSINDCEIRLEESDRGGDLSKMLGLDTQMAEPEVRLSPDRGFRATEGDGKPLIKTLNVQKRRQPFAMTQQRADLPQCMVFRDSFASAMIPFLSEHFSRSAYYWQRNVDPVAIRQEKPTIVIQEMVERIAIGETLIDQRELTTQEHKLLPKGMSLIVANELTYGIPWALRKTHVHSDGNEYVNASTDNSWHDNKWSLQSNYIAGAPFFEALSPITLTFDVWPDTYLVQVNLVSHKRPDTQRFVGSGFKYQIGANGATGLVRFDTSRSEQRLRPMGVYEVQDGRFTITLEPSDTEHWAYATYFTFTPVR